MTDPATDKKALYLRGLMMVGITVLLWSLLPILQKVALKAFSSGTIAWFRFVSAFLILYPWLHMKGSQPVLIIRRPPWLGILAGVTLAANYFGMIKGIQLSTPSNAAILIQTAPVMLVFAGILLFNEKMKRPQVFGVIVAAIGFIAFYFDQKKHTVDLSLFSIANQYILFAAVMWTIFMICQKALEHDAQLLNLLIFGVASVSLLPWVSWGEFTGVSLGYWLLLISLGLNTLIAYGTLGEAVKCLPLSHISVLVTLNPLITLVLMYILPLINASWIDPEPLGMMGYAGALSAITGVVIVVKNR